MTVAHPIFLFALLLGLIPIAIYYLIRFRSLKIEWGASYVLERALARLRKKKNIEQWILMALRVLAILALVFAFARPQSKSRTGADTGAARHRVVVLDASTSMLAGEAGATAWDNSMVLLRQLAGTWGRDDRWSLYLMDRDPHWVVDDQPVDSPERCRAVLDAIEPSESAASLVQAMDAVARKTAGRDADLFLVTDDQALTWKGMEAAVRPGGVKRAFWIRPSAGSAENLALMSLVPSHDKVLAGHPCRCVATVRNFGLQPVENAGIDVLVDGAFYAREQVSLLPGQMARVAVDIVIGEAGSHAVTARLQKDALEADNAASAGVEGVPALSILVLKDAERTDKFASAWSFVDLAARVMARKAEDGSPLYAGGVMNTRLHEGSLDAAALAGADAVVVDGGFTLTPGAAGVLRDYVRGGGGLVLAADDTVDLKAWNGLLGGAGLLPTRLQGARREALGSDRFRTLAPDGFEAPALGALASGTEGAITASRLYSWTDFEDPGEGTAVLARFTDGRPFALAKRFEPGMVILLGAGLNSRNNNLMVREFAYPLLVNLFSEAASAALYPRTVAVGAPIRLRIPGVEPPTAVQWGLQGRPAVTVPAGDAGVVTVAEGSDRGGLGSLLVTWKDRFERVWVGVQGDRADSDLRPLDPAVRSRIVSRLDLVEASTWDDLQAGLTAGYGGEEWYHWVILAVLILLFGEMAFQRRFQ